MPEACSKEASSVCLSLAVAVVIAEGITRRVGLITSDAKRDANVAIAHAFARRGSQVETWATRHLGSIRISPTQDPSPRWESAGHRDDAVAKTHVAYRVYIRRPTIPPGRASVDSSIRSDESSCCAAMPCFPFHD
jgi:hypothetical protein